MRLPPGRVLCGAEGYSYSLDDTGYFLALCMKLGIFGIICAYANDEIMTSAMTKNRIRSDKLRRTFSKELLAV